MKKKIKGIKESGFTLVELLVVIVIIGIITVLALPGIQQLQARNYNKKYEAYADSLKSAAKLYTDAYSIDMFGVIGNGCYDISYSELYSKSLIKDYATDGITCDDPKTFVQVKRDLSGKYTYDVSLKCKKRNKVVYEKVITRCDEQALTASDVPIILVDVKNVGGYDGWSSSKEVTIKLAAKDGLNNNAYISYGWTTDPSVLPTEMKVYNFRNDTGTSEVSMSFTETGRNGIWHLFVDGDNVIDVGGRYANDTIVENIKFDNTDPETPVLNNPYNDVWVGEEVVSSNKYVIGITSSDTYSGIKEYQYRYPNSNATWTSYSNSSGDSFTTTPFKTAREEIVEIRACDYSGNCSDVASSMIKIDRTAPTCTVSLNGISGENGWYKTSNVVVSLNTNDSGGSVVSGFDLTTSSSPTYGGNASDSQGNTVATGINWYGYVKDGAGNVGNCESGIFKVDVSAPTCTLNVASSGISFASATDIGNSGVAAKGINTSTSPSYSATTAGLSVNTFYGHVKDAAGNTNNCSASVIGTNVSSYNKTTRTCTRWISSYTITTKTCYRKVSSYTCYRVDSATDTVKYKYNASSCTGNWKIYSTNWSYYWGSTYTNTTSSCSNNKIGCGSSTVNTTYRSCSTNYGYGFSDSTTSVASCSPTGSFSCNSGYYGSSYVSACTPTGYSCSQGYTQLNNSYCGKVN